MLQRAAKRLTIDLSRSVMVGDRADDVAAGAAAGCWTVLLGDQALELASQPDHCVRTLTEAVPWILAISEQRGR
jgi:D-glycero-D-manno-heptose 1,7-bisphosphate phosphatase